MIEQRVSMVTLGVSDLARARAFYEEIGWVPSGQSTDEIVFFQAGCLVLGLWGRDELAADSGTDDTRGWGGVTLAYNVRSRNQVDDIVEAGRRAGATVTREPADTFWGGYSGVFIDPDGHPWEVAHNPGWELTDDGSVRLPE